MTYKLGSLFDGSGGFPLAGTLCGIEPVWASEVEPYPIAVTRSRFPYVKHLGDISKIHGGKIEPVDIITFGSPCQDLSVAGKRAGLKHEANGDEETTRSGLFMEAVRIIKEMREATDGEYPRFALWENVPGAFSSNKGEDFRIVLEELIRVTTPNASMPPVPKAGWNYADSYVFDGGSLAYRVLDAQYWGVPQRRRRIYLVADFRGECAREILFEREGLRGYFAEGRTPWQTTPADAQGSTGADDPEGTAGRGLLTPSSPCYSDGLLGGLGGRQLDAVGFINAIGGNAENSQETQISPTLTNGTAPGFQNAVAFAANQRDEVRDLGDKAGALQAQPGMKQQTFIIDNVGGQAEYAKASSANGTLRAGAQGLVAYSVENHPADSRVNIDDSGKVQTLTSRMGTGGGNVPMVMEPFCKSARGKFKGDAETWKDAKVANTLNTFDTGETRANELVVMATQQGGAEIRTDGKAPTLTAAAGMSGNNQPVICLQGNGIDRADTAGCNGKGWREDASYTLNTIDRPAVVYAVDQGGGKSGANVSEGKAPTLCTTHGGEPAVAYGLDRASFNQGQNAKFDFAVTEESQPTLTARGPGAVCCTTGSYMQVTEEVSPTLMARDWKDPTCVSTNYIVRRLTPTECARLQGFADWWGYLEAVDSFSQKDYQFWLKARHTHEVIVKGKDPNDLKEYTVKQMLTWYNKLWTDSAEYKMWGNGIALPTALYCLQGIAEALERAKNTTPTECADLRGIAAEEEDAWML